jgi:integrase
LAGLATSNAPSSEFIANAHPSLSYQAILLLWRGLAAPTRRNYSSAVSSYEFFCAEKGVLAWPTDELTLAQWVAARAFGNATPGQGQLKPDTMNAYLSALRSVHVDQRLSVEVFESLWLRRIMQGYRATFPPSVRKRLPITKDLLTSITSNVSSLDDINASVAFLVAWAGFLRMGEITYDLPPSRDPTFTATKVTRSDITFAVNDQYAILRLKRSKTDRDYTGVEVVLAAINEPTCPVRALRLLFTQDVQPQSAPLFRFQDTHFSRSALVQTLRSRLTRAGYNSSPYSGHSFRRGAAQHASDNGMLDEHIQALGRWSSAAFQLYFKSSLASRYRLNMRFQTSRSAPL